MEKMNDTKALAVIPRTMQEVQSMAEVLAKSNLLPSALRGKAADVAVQILAGQELGLAPMASIRGVHVYEGKPILAADTMVALCLGSGVCEYFICAEETSSSVTYETKRNGSPQAQRFTWSDEDTKAAGLNTKDNWRLHKRQMRRARCKAVLARDVYPDVLAGCYDPDEEMVAVRSAPHTDAIGAEFVDAPSDPLSSIDAAESVDALKALAPTLNKLQDDAKKTARARYQARMEQLTKRECSAGLVGAANLVLAPAEEPTA